MFNLSGSEMVFLLLVALIVLGPEKLPEAVRKFGKVYAEAKKMSTGFQSELKSALDEPMREMRETAEAFKNAANINFDIDADVTPDPPDEPVTTNEPPLTSPNSQHVADQLEAIEETIAAHPDVVETGDETATE